MQTAFVTEEKKSRPKRGPIWRWAVLDLLLAGGMLFLADAAVFRSGLYFQIAEPDSAAAAFEREMRLERARERDHRKQILIVGDSRSQAIRPRLAEEGSKQFGTVFANVNVQGSTPRAWYYLLRALDPDANRYNVLVFGVDNYDDNDDNARSESTQEVEMPVSSLHLRDLFDYPWTFRGPGYRRDAFLEIVIEGSAYKRDLQELLLHPVERARKTAQSHESYGPYMWDYVGSERSLAGLEVDWAAGKLKFPESADAATRDILQVWVDNPAYPDTGSKAALRREWLGRIARHYRGSHTLLVFVRLPTTPIPLPADRQPAPIRGMLRDLAAQQSNVLLLDEHLCDGLERPEYFYDYMHLNAVGATEVTKILVDQLRMILGRIPRG
ncbi:MAG TPA: hypothetical protein VGV35_09500 [Bryobacteraceae bacterium]|nr:hypothetical protein [Bryobacteraceae bacterium]